MIFNLDLSFGPKWENISIIRVFINDMLSIGIIAKQDATNVSTAVSELMENIVKYTSAGGALISLKKNTNLGMISLCMSNVCTKEDAEKFENIYTDIIQGSPKDAYKKRMINSMKNEKLSQLGLARIRYECKGEITYDISDNLADVKSSLAIDEHDEGYKLLTVEVKIPVQLSENTEEEV